MKKIIIKCVATMFVVGLLYSSADAQGIAMKDKPGENSLYAADKEEADDIGSARNVNSRILRSFYKTYGENTVAKWSKTDNGFAVSFNNNGVKTNVYYRNSGAVDYKINYYFEDKLPKDVRHNVLSNFYDYKITQVSEVHKNGSVGYFVKIEDKHHIKTVRVINDELEVVETLVKK